MSLETIETPKTIETPETVPETETEFKGTIYTIDFPNGKRYIGLTERSLHARYLHHRHCARNPSANSSIVYNAIRKHDMVESFELTVIDTSAKDFEHLKKLEIHFIKKFNTYMGNPKSGGYNMTLGGEGAHGCIKTRDMRIKASLAQMKSDVRPFSCWNLSTGAFEGKFNTFFEATEKINKRVTRIDFTHIFSGYSISSRGYIARYCDEFPADFAENPVKVIEWYEEQCIERKREAEKKTRKELKCFDMFREGNFIKRFDFYCDCQAFIKTTYNIDGTIDIGDVLKGRIPSSKGFRFRYSEDTNPLPNIRKVVTNKEFTVYRENAFIGTFSKQNVAIKYLQEKYNIKSISVSACLKQKIKSSHGFRFEYID